MERDHLASLAGFFSETDPLAAGETVRLGEDAAHHMRVRRLDVGTVVYLANGAGNQATGSITRLAKREAEVRISDVATFARPPAIHMLVPISDRDRMLWLAEKATELGLTSWRPVMWQRSRSVSPRGEGAAFASRARARMRSALLQSHSPWLPAMFADAGPAVAVDELPVNGSRLVLDAGGAPISKAVIEPPVTIAVGPEGGLEASELELLSSARFRRVSLGANVLRFETAALAALAITRSVLDESLENTGRSDG